MAAPALVALAHGSRDPRSAATITALVDEVRAMRPDLKIERAWLAGLLLVIALAPIIMSEITLLLPLSMMFAAAAGPLFGLSSQKSTCRECGAQIGARVSIPHAKPDSSRTR
jgi:hypothetical protein